MCLTTQERRLARDRGMSEGKKSDFKNNNKSFDRRKKTGTTNEIITNEVINVNLNKNYSIVIPVFEIYNKKLFIAMRI